MTARTDGSDLRYVSTGVRCWEITAACRTPFLRGPDRTMSAPVFSPDGERLALVYRVEDTDRWRLGVVSDATIGSLQYVTGDFDRDTRIVPLAWNDKEWAHL